MYETRQQFVLHALLGAWIIVKWLAIATMPGWVAAIFLGWDWVLIGSFVFWTGLAGIWLVTNILAALGESFRTGV